MFNLGRSNKEAEKKSNGARAKGPENTDLTCMLRHSLHLHMKARRAGRMDAIVKNQKGAKNHGKRNEGLILHRGKALSFIAK